MCCGLALQLYASVVRFSCASSSFGPRALPPEVKRRSRDSGPRCLASWALGLGLDIEVAATALI